MKGATRGPPLKPKRRRRQLVKRCIQAAALVGFVIQSVQVSVLFFEYTTTTQLKMQTPEVILVRSVALCIRYHELLDQEALEREASNSSSRRALQPLDSLAAGISQEDALTVAQVFRLTPEPEALLSSCVSRPDNWRYTRLSGSACYDVFNVSRFFTLEYMCYVVAERLERNLSLASVTHSSFLQHRVYEVTLGHVFRHSVIVMPIVFTDGLPFRSRDYTSALPPLRVSGSDMRDLNQQQAFNIFDVYGSDVSFHRLPPPYDTRCVDRPYDSLFFCRRSCLVREFASFDRLPGFELLTPDFAHLLDRRVFSVKDLNDSQMLEQATLAYATCGRECRFTPCVSGYVKTTKRAMRDRSDDLRFSYLTSADPSVAIHAQATMTFIEYFSFLSGCFGTWFGVSFLSLRHLRLRCSLRQTERKADREETRNFPSLLVSRIGGVAGTPVAPQQFQSSWRRLRRPHISEKITPSHHSFVARRIRF